MARGRSLHADLFAVNEFCRLRQIDRERLRDSVKVGGGQHVGLSFFSIPGPDSVTRTSHKCNKKVSPM